MSSLIVWLCIIAGSIVLDQVTKLLVVRYLMDNSPVTVIDGVFRFSYVETQMTGLEGVVTTFTIEDEKTVTLRRTGKVNSMMVFELGRIDDSLYEAGPGALMLRVQTKSLGVLMNEHGGIFDLSYSIEVEYATCGLNSYHIEIRVT